MDAISIKAFIVGPIGDRDAADGTPARLAYEEGVQVLEEVIEPACKAFGVEPLRADQMARTGEIPEQVFRQLRDAPLVIADLTGANPNVMYELGLRHTTGKLTIQIGERERLPFDVAAIRTIMFKRSPAGLVEARKRLTQTLAAGLEAGGDPVTATRVWFEVDRIDEPAASAEESSEVDEPGFLEKLADAEDGMQSMTQSAVAAGALLEDIARVLGEGAARLREADTRAARSAERMALVNRVAALLQDPAERLQVVAGDLDQSVRRLEPGLIYLLDRLTERPNELSGQQEFVSAITNLVSAAQTGMIDAALAFSAVIDSTGTPTRQFKQVTRAISGSVQRMVEAGRRLVALKPRVNRLQ